jgi:hypothetical protein
MSLPTHSEGGEDCCDSPFHCPECGGHHFGTSRLDKDESEWVVCCHEEYGACGWSGVYVNHVRND